MRRAAHRGDQRSRDRRALQGRRQLSGYVEEPPRLAQLPDDKATGRYTESAVRPLLRVLYKGRATYTYVLGFYPDLPDCDPTCETRFAEMYGYDPKKSVVAVVQPRARERRANWYLRAAPPSKEAVEPLIELVSPRTAGSVGSSSL